MCDVMGSRLDLTRSQILAFRRRVGALDEVSTVVQDVTSTPARTLREVLAEQRGVLLGG